MKLSKGDGMKLSWLTLSLAAVALSGCGSMVYGPTPAPVINHSNYGQQVNLNPNVPQTGNVFAPAVQQTRPPAQQQLAQQQPRLPAATPVQQPSPYQQTTQQRGWDTPAQPVTNTPARIYDEPKLPGNSTAPVTNSTTPPPVETTRPTPVRPPERTTTSTTPTPASTPTRNDTASTPPPVETVRQPPQAAEPTQQQVASNKPAASGGGNTAVSTLLKQASASLGKGDLDGAAAYLENAQRIEPQNSKILYDIANIRYHQGRHREAESMASRAVQVGGDNAIKKKAWSLISKSRSELGDHQGAINAANKANDL